MNMLNVSDWEFLCPKAYPFGRNGKSGEFPAGSECVNFEHCLTGNSAVIFLFYV
jgi:hypothetical protein